MATTHCKGERREPAIKPAANSHSVAGIVMPARASSLIGLGPRLRGDDYTVGRRHKRINRK
jgi:hypothetical protein